MRGAGKAKPLKAPKKAEKDYDDSDLEFVSPSPLWAWAACVTVRVWGKGFWQNTQPIPATRTLKAPGLPAPGSPRDGCHPPLPSPRRVSCVAQLAKKKAEDAALKELKAKVRLLRPALSGGCSNCMQLHVPRTSHATHGACVLLACACVGPCAGRSGLHACMP